MKAAFLCLPSALLIAMSRVNGTQNIHNIGKIKF